MASLRDIKQRIAGVKKTQQITRALKMVAAVKFRKAQQSILQARPYANRLNEIVTRFLALTKERAQLTDFTDVSSLAEEIIALLRLEAESKQIKIDTEIEPAIKLKVSPDRFKQMLLNLLRNAVEASPVGGKVKVTLCDESKRVVLTVSDSGEAIPDDIKRQKNIFFQYDF